MVNLIMALLLSLLVVVARAEVERFPDEDYKMVDESYYDDIQADEDQHTADNYVFGATYIAIAAAGLLANSVVLFVIFCGNEITKTVTAIYVVQLAIADITFLIVLLLFAMQQIKQRWNFGQATCVICQTVKYLNYYAGMFFLTAMSLDRYVAVAYSTRARQIRTTKRTLIVCGIVWIASILMSTPAMLYAKIETVGYDRNICRVIFPGYDGFDGSEFVIEIFYVNHTEVGEEDYGNYSHPDDLQSNYPDMDNVSFSDPLYYNCKHHEPFGFLFNEVVKLIVGYVIPLTIIIISYLLILKKLRESSESLRASSLSSQSHNMRQRVTRMVVALVVCFSLCWFPYQVYSIILIPGFPVSGSESLCYRIENILIVIAYFNSILNPLLYTFLGHNFRKRLSDSWKKTRNRIHYRSFEFGSIHRKSFFHKTASSRKPAGYCAPFSRISPVDSGQESVTVDSENPGRHHSTKATLLVELHTEKQTPDLLVNGQSNQFDKSEFLSRS